MPNDTLFLQIHALTPFTAALLNRDDVGRAKRLPYGGTTRLRVSSQCQKRHWRETASTWQLGDFDDPATSSATPGTVRSRKTFSRVIAKPLVEQDGFAAADVIAVLEALKDTVLGKSEKAKAEKPAGKRKDRKASDQTSAEDTPPAAPDDPLAVLDTNQVIVLGRPEIDFLRDTAADVLRARPNDLKTAIERRFKDKTTRDNLAALRLAAGLDAALFGRMVTSDILARGDGAVHVAHALTVHGEEAEPEYFVAIDDLTREAGELGTGLIQTTELTSGVYYAYVVVDVPLLVSNLEGVPPTEWRSADRRLASRVIERLVGVIATTSPGAKRGSTAPYGYADLMLVEAGRRQPRSLMSAFHRAVPRQGARDAAAAALFDHLGRFDRMYGNEEQRRVASLLDLPPGASAEPAGGLASLASWAGSLVGADAGA